jgi:hypothetical protein
MVVKLPECRREGKKETRRRSGPGEGVTRTPWSPPSPKLRRTSLRHLGLWEQGVRVHTGADPPAENTLEPWLEDPFPDYETEPILTHPIL